MPTLSPSTSPGLAPFPRIIDMRVLDLPGLRARVEGPASLLATVYPLFPVAAFRAPCDGSVPPPTRFVVSADPIAARRYRIAQDGQPRWTNLRWAELPALLEWAITMSAVDHFGERHLLIHAGAVALHRQGLLLPAPSGSGKSTLTAALVAAGFHLGSDEVGMIDRPTARLLPFPKSLCVKSGSRAALTARAPGLLTSAPTHPRGDDRAWYAAPPTDAWLPAATPVRFIVFPRYSAGARTVLSPLTRAAAFSRLLELSFSARHLGPAGVACAVALVRDATCYTLTIGDLAEAVALLRGCYD